MSMVSLVVPRCPAAGGGRRQRRGKTPPLANCGVIVQRCSNRSSEAGSTWSAAVGGGQCGCPPNRVAKRIEHVPHSDPPRVVLNALNPEYDSYERLAEEVRVVGRAVWVSRRL